MTHEHSFVPPEDITEQEWQVVHANFLRAAYELDELVDLLKGHLEATEGSCSGPWCAPAPMIQRIEIYNNHQLAILLHQAIYRLGLLEAKVVVGEAE
jgi:hypothetical protein